MDLVLFEEKNGLGIITLNVPKSLNSLNTTMIDLITPKLKEWESNPNIKAVLQKSSSEKAFCAGGDVIALYNSFKDKTNYAADFFTKEYELDLLIHRYSKPIVCFAHGIVMGGGIGIMNGSSHRIVTEKTKLAMPELTIGFFPDVGASYFLNRAPGKAGLFMGLTGCRLTPSDCLYANMADSFVPSEKLTQLEAELTKASWVDTHAENHAIIDRLITPLTGNTSDLPPSPLKENQAAIDALCQHEDIQSLARAWKQHHTTNKWIEKNLKNFRAGSPTSTAVLFEQIKRGKDLDIAQAFNMELTIAKHFAKNSVDFIEGVRALLIEKVNNPSWKPKTHEEITPEEISAYFG